MSILMLEIKERSFGEAQIDAYNELIENYDEISDCLDQALVSVQASNETVPFTILGMRAEGGIASSILSVALTFYVTLITQLSNNVGQVLSGIGL